MFWETFRVTFSATLQVLLLAACGFFCVRRKLLDEKGLNQITALLVNLFLPAFSFTQLVQNFRFEEYSNWWMFPLLCAGMTMAAFVLGNITGAFFKGQLKNEFLDLVSFQNSGNIPLVIVATLFSGALQHKLFVYIFLFIIGSNLMIWTLGVWLLLRGRAGEVDIKKIFNPPFAAIIVTLVLIALDWHRWIPQTLLKPAGMLGDCALPLAMFTVGGSIANITFARVDRRPVFWLLLTKLVIFPALALAGVMMLNLHFSLGFLIVLEAAVPSAVTLSLITRYYNIREEFISEGLFFSHIASILTIPVFLTFYMKWAGPF